MSVPNNNNYNNFRLTIPTSTGTSVLIKILSSYLQQSGLEMGVTGTTLGESAIN